MLNEKIRRQVLNGSLKDCKNHLDGNYKGYNITVHYMQPFYFVNIAASVPEGGDLASLQSFLTQQQVSTKGFGKFNVTAHFIQLSIAMPNLMKSLPKRINDIVDPVINYLINAGYTSGCGNCGDAINPLSKYEINGTYHYLCETCAKEVESSLISSQQEARLQKGNFVPGLIGALLGGLLGAILWVVIYYLGYIAGLAGAATIICAFKGYELFAKHLDKRGVITSLIVTVVMLFFANRIAWAVSAYSDLKELGVTFFDVYQNLDELIQLNELTASYYGDLIIGYVLTALCSISTIKRTWQTSNGSYSMKKLK